MTSYRVMKFGGSSLAAPERLHRVVGIIRAEEAQNGPVAIIVSAFGDTTDRLLDAVNAAAAGDNAAAARFVEAIADLAVRVGAGALEHLAPDADPTPVRAAVFERADALRTLLFGVSLVREKTAQTVDSVVSFGERISAAVVSAVLTASGQPAVNVDARTWTITDDGFGGALVDWPKTQERLDAMAPTWAGRIPIHTGFIGSTPDGRTTTLGRNGSDYTATLLARGLRAREVVRWTDVSGVMTADPDLVADAYPIRHLSYAEALELANFGAKVFHQRTMIPLIESGIPMRIRNTMSPNDAGTLIDTTGAGDADQATSVTSLENLALVGVQWRRLPEDAVLGERVLRALDEAEITVWMANQAAHGQSVAVVVPGGQLQKALDVLGRVLRAELERGDIEPLIVRKPVTLLSLVAEAMGRSANVAGRFFGSLGAVGVNVLAIAQGASSRSISAVVSSDDTATAVRTVHAAFNFSHHEVNLAVLGVGTVGAELLSQVEAQAEVLRERHGVALRLVGVANSRAHVFSADGIPLGSWSAALAAAAPAPLATLLDGLARLPVPVVVDCTSSDDIAAVLTDALLRGIHVVAANKKPFASDMASYRALADAARLHHRELRYETTVGASLPIIETLKDLVRTGDPVRQIDGSLSGTLGFVTNALSAGRDIDEAVAEARRQGYTEPNPADDLRGADAARKALILARELGISIEPAAVEVEPLVPTSVLDAPAGADDTVEALFERLRGYAPTMRARVEALAAEGNALRYLAQITVQGGEASVRVGPVGVDARHPASRLVGTEAFVAFSTGRHSTYPLLVQGAGAGASVTAAGILADVLSIARSRQGR